MIHFVGAGPGALDLITLRGWRLLQQADAIVYAGSLVNPELLQYARSGCELHNSAEMTLDEVIAVLVRVHRAGGVAVRLHTGDPAIYGAIREQFDRLRAAGVPFTVCPGVSSLFAAAAALEAEYTLPEVSQSLIVTRMAGRTAAAIVYKASWPDERVCRCTVGTLAECAAREGIDHLALLLVGHFLGEDYALSKLYDPTFSTAFRQGKQE